MCYYQMYLVSIILHVGSRLAAVGLGHHARCRTQYSPAHPLVRLTSFDPEAPLKFSSRPPLVPVVPVVPATPVPATPELPVDFAPVKLVAPTVLFDSPRASEAQASFLEPPKTPVATPTVSNLLALFEAKPAAPAVVPPPPAPPSTDPETEALKQHTARLQEQ